MVNKKENLLKDYSTTEEIFNAASHWLGVVLGFLGLFLLIHKGLKEENVSKIVSFIVYGVSFITMYLASALYHSIRNKKVKSILRVFDHSSIFLFIAGSYTPIAILSFHGYFRIITISLVWLIAIIGVIYKIFTYGRFESTKKVSLFLYLAMGWLSVFMLKAIFDSTSWVFLVLLFIGGLFYSLGTIFYSNHKIPFNHGIWHLFVLAGSIVHFSGIYTVYG